MIPHIEDRSAMEADWRCGMERYWLTEYRPAGEESSPVGGIVPVNTVWDLEFGAAFADGVAALVNAKQDARETALMVSCGMEKWGPHSMHLLQGLVYGAGIQVLPRLQIEYDIVSAEVEHFYRWPTMEDPQVIEMVRPDLVLVKREDKTGWVPDWKTTSYKNERWLMQWPTAIQMHLQAAGVQQQRPDLNIQGARVIGAYKGYEDDRTGERLSPFIFAYTGMQGQKREWSPRYVRGWDRVPVSEYPGGIFAWVDHLRLNWPVALMEQYPATPPVFINHGMLDTVMAERKARLDRMAAWRQAGRPMPAPDTWEHRTLNCNRCPYRTACWNVPTNLNPLAHGLYTRRVPNHELERLAWALTPAPTTVLK